MKQHSKWLNSTCKTLGIFILAFALVFSYGGGYKNVYAFGTDWDAEDEDGDGDEIDFASNPRMQDEDGDYIVENVDAGKAQFYEDSMSFDNNA